MTLITFQDGKVVLRDGKVGTEAACCCGANSCNCAADCDAPIVLVCDGNPDGPQPCLDPNPPVRPSFVWQASGTNSGVIRNGCLSSTNYAELTCIDGQFIVTAFQQWCCDTESLRTNVYTGVVPCDETGLPAAGEVTLEFVETIAVGDMWCDDAEPEAVPVVSITRT